MNTLLITGAIDALKSNTPYTVLTNSKERLQQYIYSIEYAIQHYTSITHIVFCENTNYRFDYSELIESAQKNRKVLEVISFEGNLQKVNERGKGYGEGEIIAYALKHSHILRQASFFYKLTGRIVVANFDRIHRKSRYLTHFITYHHFNKNKYNYVSTVFYKVSKDLFEQKIINAYQNVQDNNNIYLEVVFFQAIKEEKIKTFPVFPIIEGISGSSGQAYNVSKKRVWLENIIGKIGLRDMKLNVVARFLLKISRK